MTYTNWRQFKEIKNGMYFLVALDPSAGGTDRTFCQFLNRTHMDIPLVYSSDMTADLFLPQLVRVLEAIADITGIKPVVAIERQNGGEYLIERLSRMNLSGKFTIFKMPAISNASEPRAIPTRYGWDTNSATRPKMLMEFKSAVEAGSITIYDPITWGEIQSFIITRSGRPEAERGAKDDGVLSAAIVLQMNQYAPPPERFQTHTEVAIDLDDDLFDENGF